MDYCSRSGDNCVWAAAIASQVFSISCIPLARCSLHAGCLGGRGRVIRDCEQSGGGPKFDLHQLAGVPLGVRFALVLTAALCEEFIYRGFAIEELGAIFRNRWAGAIVSVVLFGFGHIGTYGFSTALLIQASVGLIITLLYMLRNNLPVCMLMHGSMDALFLIVVPALLGR
jgi:membrane protease YdiL (CAAX protease family)